MTKLLSDWSHLSLHPAETKEIRGGLAQDNSPCPGEQAFSCTSTYKMDDDTWTSTGIVCAKSWRHATEKVYVADRETFWGENIAIRVSCPAV